MGKVSRRRYAVSPAAIALLSLSSLGEAAATRRRRQIQTAAAPTLDAGSSSSVDPSLSSSGVTLTTAFSCGTHWTKANTCSDLCPSGTDDDCPPGQHCYAGIPCTDRGETSMEEVLERQRHLEQQEMNRLVNEREEWYVNRFVCGESYAAAEDSCNASVDEGRGRGASSFASSSDFASAHYCPSGSSYQCPSGLKCYAAVPCPRSTHDEEPSLVEEVSINIASSLLLLATEPILLNVTTSMPSSSFDGAGFGIPFSREGLMEEWSLFFFGDVTTNSPSSVLGALSTLLSSSPRYGLN